MKWLTSVLVLGAFVVAGTTSAVAADKYLSQGWNAAQRSAWYAGTQGSRIMPLTWFDALEQPASSAFFADPKFLASFGYLSESTRRYPVGFAIDKQPDDALAVTKLRWYQGQRGGKHAEPWIGMNCSACHTGQITYNGTKLRIDGAPSLTDFQSFVEALDAALRETRADKGKWERFASRVLKGRDSRENRRLLDLELARLINWQERTEALNKTPLRYGYGRVDAFGHIFNKIVLFSGSERSVKNPADAPVSFPFLWTIQKQSVVQWNGIAPAKKVRLGADNFEYGAIGRNTGEVLGVFGEVVISPQTGLLSSFNGFPSSVNVANLDLLEGLIKRLQPPKWPSQFPPIDNSLANVGGKLFKQRCKSCHDPRDGKEPTEVMRPFLTEQNKTDITDIWMACNAYTYAMPRGLLTDRNSTADQPVALRDALTEAVVGAMLHQKTELVGIALGKIFGSATDLPIVFDHIWSGIERIGKVQRRNLCLRTKSAILAYKARPLDGIWATAPYLHNGSVPTLYDLLLPAKDRPPSFYVGNREYDPKRVGYVYNVAGSGNAFRFETVDSDGNAIDGNSRQGHEYGVGELREDDRKALLEYLKTL